MPMTIRPATPDDLDTTYEVMLEATDTLDRSLGRPPGAAHPPPRTRAMAIRRLILGSDSDGFLVAEDGGRLIGFGMACVRDDVWYLAALHVTPEAQGRGVGRSLLGGLMETRAEPRVRLTISDAATSVSNGLYGSLGLYPRIPIVTLVGPPDTTSRAASAGSGPHGTSGGAGSAGEPATLEAIDAAALGFRRRDDHACWAGVPGMHRVVLGPAESPRAYAYVDERGAIGPAAAVDAPSLEQVVRQARSHPALAGLASVSIAVPGTASGLLTSLLASGSRYRRGTNLVLASTSLAPLDRSVMSGSDALF